MYNFPLIKKTKQEKPTHIRNVKVTDDSLKKNLYEKYQTLQVSFKIFLFRKT